jgi:hypothetical protein
MPSPHTCNSSSNKSNHAARFAVAPVAAWLTSSVLIFFTLTAQAENSGFDCAAAMVGSAEQQQQLAAELLDASWDTAKLVCATNALSALADSRANDYAAYLSALQANARYMYYLDRIILFELGYLIDWYVVEVPKEKKLNEPMIAMIAARERQERTLQQARAAGFDTGELKYFESLIIGPNAAALPLLQATVAEDPQSLRGAAHALMAETHYALPDIAGGDLRLAIETMRAARQRDPDNPLYARLLAGYLLDTAEDGEARSILHEILTMQADTDGLQLRADQLQAASDLATRIGDAELGQQLSAQREKMFEDYPYLQKRSVVSAMGHFGDKDPMKDPGH